VWPAAPLCIPARTVLGTPPGWLDSSTHQSWMYRPVEKYTGVSFRLETRDMDGREPKKNGRWLEEAVQSDRWWTEEATMRATFRSPARSFLFRLSRVRDATTGTRCFSGPYDTDPRTLAWRQWVLFTTRWWSRRWKGSVCDHRLITRTTAGARHHRAWMHRGGSSTSTMSCVRLFRRKWYVR
jgi:hypothetical protein